jgi:CheY-like chemotaxis protein
MYRIRIVHWNAAEAEERAGRLPAHAFAVDSDQVGQPGLRRLRQAPPDAVVIDLSRLPLQGRDLAGGLRTYKDTRRVPLIFVGGDPQKVTSIKELLLDAVYTAWDQIVGALQQTIASPPTDPLSAPRRWPAMAARPCRKSYVSELVQSSAWSARRAVLKQPWATCLRARSSSASAWGGCRGQPGPTPRHHALVHHQACRPGQSCRRDLPPGQEGWAVDHLAQVSIGPGVRPLPGSSPRDRPRRRVGRL